MVFFREPHCTFSKGAWKNFVKLLAWSSILVKLQLLQFNFKKVLHGKCFPVDFGKTSEKLSYRTPPGNCLS